jgi:hypothetical protein
VTAEPLIVTVQHDERTGTRRVLVDRWPRVVRFDRDFLGLCDPGLVSVGDGLVTVRVTNGEATYALGDLDADGTTYAARLLSSRLSEPAP